MDDSIQSKEIKQEVIDIQDDPTSDISLEDNQSSNPPTLYTELKIEEFEVKENEAEQVQVMEKRSRKDTKDKCNVDGKTYSDQHQLERRQILHTGERPFEWDHSYASFNDESTLKRLRKRRFALRRFRCKICNLTFWWKLGLVRHMQFHAGDKSYKCEMLKIKQMDKNEEDENECQENENNDNAETSITEVKSEYVLNVEDKVEDQSEHKVMMQGEHSKADNFLNNTEGSLHTELKIEEHEIKLEDQQEIVQDGEVENMDDNTSFQDVNAITSCSQNDSKSSSTKSTTILNTYQRVGETPFKSDKCDAAYKLTGSLYKHQLTHSNVRTFECHVCFSTFRARHALTRHCYTQHPQDNKYKCTKIFDCDVCHRRFLSESDFNEHRNIHSGEKPFKCDKCTTAFSHKNDLNKHRLTHPDLRPFQCEICNRGFIRKSSLTWHLFYHSGERPFECHVCFLRFRTRTVLIKHCYTQHPEDNTYKFKKGFECDVCHENFLYKSDLATHKRVHTGEKPFNCDICQKGYWKKPDLIKHLNSHTEGQGGKEEEEARPEVIYVKGDVDSESCDGTTS